MDEDSAAMFSKSYVFRIVGEKKVDVPKSGSFVRSWKVPDLLKMKKRLNAVKSGLDAMPADAWGALTQSTNVASLVVFACRTFAGAELCTQAWSKFYEIIAKFPELVSPRFSPNSGGDLRSMHLCEAPGAFIAALNHYLALKYGMGDPDGPGGWIDIGDVVEDTPRAGSPDTGPKSSCNAPNDDEESMDHNFPSFSCMNGEVETGEIESLLKGSNSSDMAYLCDDRQPAKMFGVSPNGGLSWRWIANTLNPYHEGVSSSRAIQADELICRTLEKWIFGECNTGDILKPSTKEEIISRCGGCADLVTGDGGIDCATDPGEQELLVSDLVISEALVAMSCLREGGNMVLKVFTVFETQTVCLLYLLALAFDKVIVHKPVASKPGNSELYLLCFGFLKAEVHGIVDAVMNYFNWMTQTCHGSGLMALPPLFRQEQIPAAFVRDVAEMGRYFCDLQVDTIERNLVESNIFDSGLAKRRLRNVREEVASEYLERCNLKPIPSDMYLFGARELAEHHGARPTFGGRDPDINIKSYADRMKQRTALQRLRSDRKKDDAFYAELVETVNDLIRDIMVIVDRSSLFPGLPRPENCNEQLLHGPLNEFKCPYTFRQLVKSISVEKGHPVNRILSSPYCSSSLLSQFYEFVEVIDMFSDVDELPDGVSIVETGWPVDISCAFGLPTIPKGKDQKRLGFNFTLPDGSAPPLEAFRAFGRHLHVPEDSIVIVNIRSLSDSTGYEVFHHPDAAVAGPSHRRDEMVMPLYLPSTVARLTEEEGASIRALSTASPEDFLEYFKTWIIRHLSIPHPLDPAFHELFGPIDEVKEDFLARREKYELHDGIQRYFDSVWYDFVENKIYPDRQSHPSLRPLLQDAQESDTGLYRRDPALLKRTVSAMVMLFEAHLRALPKGMNSQEFSIFVRRREDRVGLDLLHETTLLEAGKEELLKSEVVDNLIHFFKENQLWYMDRLALRGFHLLTRFNVSIFLLLASLFKRCSLGKDGERPEVLFWYFQGTEEDVEDLVRILEEIQDFLRARMDGYDQAGHNFRQDGREEPSILSLFDNGVDSPVLRNRSVTSFARKVNFQYVRGRVRHHLAQVFANGPDLMDMTSSGDRMMGD